MQQITSIINNLKYFILQTSSVQADSATDLGEDDAQASMGLGCEMSGRCSDADPGESSDIDMRSSTSSGSGICNSTPQVSPAVSDVDENSEMDPKFCVSGVLQISALKMFQISNAKSTPHSIKVWISRSFRF